jgi:universal stress protein A
VLFATDFSRASKPAWKKALALARANRARLRIVHAMEPLAGGQPARWAYAEAEAEVRADVRKRLQELVREARRSGLRAEALVLRGVPREAIVRAARGLKGAWIVVGTHGRTGFPSVFLGSVASRVVATAPCPVLTVRGAKGR